MHPAGMARGEGNPKAIRRDVGEPMHGVGPEIVIFLCSPSVITGEPVASKRSTVSRIASS